MTALGPFVTGVDRFDTAAWTEAVTALIAGEDAAGRAADEFEVYDDVEAELMKRGTLSQGSIRWKDTADAAATLMRTSSKDLRLLLALILAAPHVYGEEAVEMALMASAQFFSCFGGSAFPRDKTRTRAVEKCIAALSELAEKSKPRRMNGEEEAACRTALDRLAEAVAEQSPDLGLATATIAGAFRAAPPVALGEAGGLDTFLASTPAQAEVIAPVVAAAAPRSDQLRLDPGNERALKQSLSTVAEFLLELDPAHPLSYRLRRFATWWGIKGAPPIKTADRTVIIAVAEEQAERYRAAVEKGAVDAPLVSKLERACHLQPFWLEGQRIQASIARALGRDEVEIAIRDETARFLKAASDLEKLRFSDGSPIVPQAVASWLRESEHGVAAPAAPGAAEASADDESGGLVVVDRDVQAAYRRARTLARQGSLDQALASLDEARAGAKGLRAQTLWEIFILEHLRDFGLRSHASRQAERLADAIAQTAVREWEPELFKRLDRLKA